MAKKKSAGKKFGIVGVGSHWRKFKCLALKVHPSQVKDANEDVKRMGLKDCRFEEGTGMACFSTRRAYNEYLKAKGLHNNDAGYGDWAGR